MTTRTNFRLIVCLFTLIYVTSCSPDTIIVDNSEEEVNIPTEDDIIQEWNTLWIELDRYADGMRPNACARSLAYIHLAAYETAVADMVEYNSVESKFDGLDIREENRPNDIDMRSSLNAAYAGSIKHFVYNLPDGMKSRIDSLYENTISKLNLELSPDVVGVSEDWANHVVQSVINFSQSDTEAEQQILDPQPNSYVPPIGQGYWTFNAEPERALFPYWESVRTFVISSEETSSVAPNMEYSEDENSDWYKEMYEVYEANNKAREEQNESLRIAEFWSDDATGLMVSPPGRQISIAIQLIENQELSYENSLAMLLKLGFSLNDAAVSTWADKYKYMVMRPSEYIREHIDVDYQTNLFKFVFWPNPSFPGYPSGHSTFASAAAGVFIDTFGDISFIDNTHKGRVEFEGNPRFYNKLSDMAVENAYSRIPLGVHIRIDCTEGLRLGYEISDAVNQFSLK